MALINRLHRLFRADLHAVLDQIEQPEVLLRESVREMAAVIDTDRCGLQELTQHGQALEGQQQALNDELQKLAQELDVCFAAEQQALARGVIKRRLQTEQALVELDQHQQKVRSQVVELTERLQQYRSRLQAIEQKLALFDSREAVNRSGPIQQQPTPLFGTFGGTSDVDEAAVEVAFLAEKQRRAS